MSNGHENRPPPDDFDLQRLEIIEPTRLAGLPIPDRKWTVEGWVPKGAVTLLMGDGGTGKSLVAQQLLTCCATGKSFLGLKTEPCKAFGIFCEDDGPELHRRQDAINRMLDLEFGDLDDLRWVSRVGGDNVLMTFEANRKAKTTDLYQQIERAIVELGAGIVVIDTAADTFGGNENVRIEVRQFLAGALGGLATKYDVAIVLLAHPSAEGMRSGRGDGGSTAWSNSVRSRLYLSRPEVEEGEQPDEAARVLSRQKANYASAGVTLEMRFVDGAFECREASPDSFLTDKIRRENAKKAFLDGMRELASKGMRCNNSKNQQNYGPRSVMELTAAGEGYSLKALEKAKNALIREGRIESVVDGPKSRPRARLVIVDD